jgi:hypothetical protein
VVSFVVSNAAKCTATRPNGFPTRSGFWRSLSGADSPARLLAIQRVEDSNPISRSQGRPRVCGTSLAPTTTRRQSGHKAREGFGDGIGDRPRFAPSPGGPHRGPKGRKPALQAGLRFEVSDGTRTRDRLDHNQEPEVAADPGVLGRRRCPAARDLARRRCEVGAGPQNWACGGERCSVGGLGSAGMRPECDLEHRRRRRTSHLLAVARRTGSRRIPAVAGVFMISPNRAERPGQDSNLRPAA